MTGGVMACSTGYCQCAAKDAELAELRAKLAEAREAAAYAYQLAGLVGAGERALDNLSAVAHGEQPRHEWPVAESAKLAEAERQAVTARSAIRHAIQLISGNGGNRNECLDDLRTALSFEPKKDAAREATDAE
jgi:hypothetical protein